MDDPGGGHSRFWEEPLERVLAGARRLAIRRRHEHPFVRALRAVDDALLELGDLPDVQRELERLRGDVAELVRRSVDERSRVFCACGHSWHGHFAAGARASWCRWPGCACGEAHRTAEERAVAVGRGVERDSGEARARRLGRALLSDRIVARRGTRVTPSPPSTDSKPGRARRSSGRKAA